MLKQVKQLLEPPIFYSDEDVTRTAQVLYVLLRNILILMVPATLATIFITVQKIRAGIILFILLILVLISWALVRRRHILFASRLFVAGLWTLFVSFYVLGGRTASASMNLLLGTAVIAGIPLGKRSAILLFGLNSLIGLGMAILESRGYPLVHYFPGPPIPSWATWTLALLLTITPLNLTLQISDQSLRRAHKSEARYRALFEQSPDGIVLLNLETFQPVEFNDQACRQLGYTREEFDKLTLKDIEAVDTVEESLAHLQKVVHEGRDDFETRQYTKQGETRDVYVTAQLTEVGEHPVLHCIWRDITERKQALEALRIENERFQRFVESNIVGIVIAGASGQIIAANDSYLKLLGLTRQDFLDGNVDWRKFTPPEWLPADGKAIQELREHGVCEPYEKEYERMDGTRVPVYIADAMLPGPEEQIAAFVLDITERKQAEAHIQRQLERLRALRLIDLAISSSFDLHIILNVVLQQVLSQLGVDASAVLLFNPDTQTIKYAGGKGFRSNAIQHTQLRLGEGFAGRAVLERGTIHVSDLKGAGGKLAEALYLANEDFTEYYGTPLLVKGIVKGVLEIFHRSRMEPDQDWLDFLETLAGQAAIAIDNAQLFEEMQKSNVELVIAYDATIAGWSRAMDLRDKETEGHSQRVTELTLILADRMGISEQEQVHIRRGALLHDIGKLGIPDQILLKPGALNEQEWDSMRRHPVYAFEMLSPISYLRPALDIPYCHHEKWDETGLPARIAGGADPVGGSHLCRCGCMGRTHQRPSLSRCLVQTGNPGIH